MELPKMLPFSVEYLATPTRSVKRSRTDPEDTETDSSSPSTSSSSGSPTLHLALSGEDALESPPLRPRPAKKPRTSTEDREQEEEEQEEGHRRSPGSKNPADPNEKPPHSYMALISMAILQDPKKKLLLGDIYQFIMDKFAFYKNSTDKAWRNSIRHNLSLNECFIKSGRAENGKGNFWAIHPACEADFAKGDFRRRQARRRARRSQEMNVSKLPMAYRCNLGYVQMKSTPASGVSLPLGATTAGGLPSTGAGYGQYPIPHTVRSHPYDRPTPQTTTHHHQQLYPAGGVGHYPGGNYGQYGGPPSVSPPSSHLQGVTSDPHLYYTGVPHPRLTFDPVARTTSDATVSYTMPSATTSTTSLSSCVYQSSTSPQSGYPHSSQSGVPVSPPGTSPGTGTGTTMAQFSLRDMPALRDAISGLPGFCS